MRGTLIALGAALLLAAPAQAATLGAGDAWFADGPEGAQPCGPRCWTYGLTTTEAADRLRVGVDHATVGEVWTVNVEGPDGEGETFSPGIGLYSQEAVVEDPARGEWTITATAAADVRDLRFRLRAALERDPAVAPRGPQLPNLQALPPWDLSFTLPVTNGGALSVPSGSGSAGVATPGGRASCHPEEVLLEQAVRCLRMAFGVRNTGNGPMALEVGPGVQGTDRALFQDVLQADGRYVRRDAGRAVYHATHQHYHHDKAIGLTLWRVDDAQAGRLSLAAPEHLKGFAHRNELLREWRVFYPLHRDRGFGLRAGWGDYYEWDRPGNYIDFGTNADGRYVLRLVADPVAGIEESNEADNVAYSLIEVAGDRVTLLESGRGSDPWDRCRILVPHGPEPDLPAGEGGPRPADCPPDDSLPPAA
jgi:hypothetical protein